MQGPGWAQEQEQEQQRQWGQWQAWQLRQQHAVSACEPNNFQHQWQPSQGYVQPPLPLERQAQPSPSCPPPAKRQRVEALDQHALFLQAAGGKPGGQQGGAAVVRVSALPSSKAKRRAANAAAAASVAALPSSAAGEYLEAYPAVKRLLQRFKAELRVDQFPLQLLNEYASRLMYQVVWTIAQESHVGGFRVTVRLTNKRDGETVESGEGLARNKQAGKQVAAAACLERLLETAVDEEAQLRPDAKADGKKKSWQAPQRPGLGADSGANGSAGGFRSSYGGSGYGGGGIRRGSGHRSSFGFGSPPFVRGGTMVPAGAGFELKPTPGSAAGRGRFASASPQTPWRPPSLQAQLSSFEAVSLPNASKQFTSSGAVRSGPGANGAAPSSAASWRSGGGNDGQSGSATVPLAAGGTTPGLGSVGGGDAGEHDLGWAATEDGELPPLPPAEAAAAESDGTGLPKAAWPSLPRPSSPRPAQFQFVYGDPEEEVRRAEQQEAMLRQWQAQAEQAAARAQALAAHWASLPRPAAQQQAQPPGWAHQQQQQQQQQHGEQHRKRWDCDAAGQEPRDWPGAEGRQRWRGSRSRSRSRSRDWQRKRSRKRPRSSSRQGRHRSRSRERQHRSRSGERQHCSRSRQRRHRTRSRSRERHRSRSSTRRHHKHGKERRHSRSWDREQRRSSTERRRSRSRSRSREDR
ncbi:hypothetical protein ABPG75_003683 [Micractinium tetrahymenae]